MMWATNIEQSFLEMCSYLHMCASNGIMPNPKKLQFCQDTVDFPGLQVSPTSVMSSAKLL